jgi:membrane fusion protein (multidrug efflux system)
MSKYVFAVGAIIIVTALIGLATYSNFATHSQAAITPPTPVTPVVVASVQRAEFAEELEAIGTARANESITITAQVTETVRRVNFEDGMSVNQGDILVELTDTEENAELREARIALDEAEKQLRRVANLVQRDLTT